MRCPKCFSKELVAFQVEGRNLVIDKCPLCGGMWFDGTELETVLEDLAEIDLEVPIGSEMTNFPCPRCHRKLYMFNYPKTYAKIDMCNACNGIWLDRNEFEEISMVRKHNKNNNFDEAPLENTNESLKERIINFINNSIDNLSTY